MNGLHNVALRYFLTASVEDTLDAFRGLDRSVSGRGFVYVPGTRQGMDRILLCAHADTVRKFPLSLTQLKVSGQEVFTTSDTHPLGADDRAGCAMLSLLNDKHEGAHSLLICDGEESGGIGISQAVRCIPGELRDHAFAVEVDRAGSEEMVFYNGTSNDDFELELDEWFPKWKQGLGSFTDISHLCPEVGICGVNLAAGYYGQHTSWERLVYAEWLTTYKALDRLLSLTSYPDVGEPDPLIQWDYPRGRSTYGTGRWDWWCDEPEDETELAAWWQRYTKDEKGNTADLPDVEIVDKDDPDDDPADDPSTSQRLPMLNAAGDIVSMVEATRATAEDRDRGWVDATTAAPAEAVDDESAAD